MTSHLLIVNAHQHKLPIKYAEIQFITQIMGEALCVLVCPPFLLCTNIRARTSPQWQWDANVVKDTSAMRG